MDVLVLKIILLGLMTITTVVFGLIPVRLMQILHQTSAKTEKKASFIISLLSCFAGGVFLGVCFLDLLPDACTSFTRWSGSSDLDSTYPYVPLFFTCGFFLVKLFEGITETFCGHKNANRRKHAATFVSVISIEIEPCECADSHHEATNVKIIKSLTFVVALMFHASLEGFAFGVQESTLSATSLFCGIIVHKAVVSFSIGMRLVEANPTQRWLVIMLVIAVAVATPIGGSVGIVFEGSAMYGHTKDAVTCVLLSLALGTFIYITFFEILVPENSKRYNKFAQWLASVIGFAIIAAMMAFQ